MMRASMLLAATALTLVPSVALASETITYSYDPRGRLVSVAHSGGINAGAVTDYAFDKADNRLSKITTGGATSPPSLAVNDVSASEGSSLLFTVTRSGSTTDSVTVDFATANGTAIAGTDYTAASGTLTLGSGITTQTVTVATIDDTAVESSETALVNLSNATGATISDSQGVGTIGDNDSGAVTFAVSDTSATEGQPLVFTITKTGSTATNVSVSYQTMRNTAREQDDFQAANGTVTFLPAETSKTVSVVTVNDNRREDLESMFFELSGASGGTITDSQGVGTILDND